MTELTIERFTSTVEVRDGDAETTARLRRLADQVAGSRLDRAATKAALPPGYWCVRRVAVPLVLDLGRPTVALEEQWAQAVIDAIGAAIDHPTADVVHYRRPADGLCDLVVSTARRTTEREWAWRQIGLLAPGDISPDADPQATLLHALRRFPREAVHAVAAAIREVGLAAMHRLLGTAGWQALVVIVCAGAGYPVPARTNHVIASAAASARCVPGDRIYRSAPPSTHPAPSPTHIERMTLAAAANLAASAVARSVLAAAFLRSAPRPDPALSWSWAVLIAAEADPSILARTNAVDVIDSIAVQIDNQFEHTSHGIGLHTAAQQTPPTRTPPQAEASEIAEAADPPDTHVTTALETDWAGLLFFLNTAADAGLPGALLDDDVLAGRPLADILSAVARRIVPAAPDDPAVLALSGEPLNPRTFASYSVSEAERVAEYAHRWIVATAARIGDRDSEPELVVQRVVSRRGIIDARPGWVDVRLDLSDVDVDVRIAGLDVDPGWVPWLGLVVEFSYV